MSDLDLALAVTAEQGRVQLSDTSCGRCAQCDAGWLLWCSRPGMPRRSVRVDVPTAAVRELYEAAVTVSALAEAWVHARVVLVHGDASGAVAAAAVAMKASAVLSVGEPSRARNDRVLVGSHDEVRAHLAGLTPTGRADVVVAAGGDARRAVRAVVRGGHVALGSTVVPAATTTEVVQRELRVVGPKDAWRLFSPLVGSDVLQGVEAALAAWQE